MRFLGKHLRRSTLGVTALSALCASTIANAGEYSIEREELDATNVKSPRAAELLAEGEALFVRGDLDGADARFLRATREYPDGSIAWRRHCEAMTALGHRAEAVSACSRAVQSVRSNANVLALVHALVDGPQPPTSAELFQALTLADAERTRAPGTITPVLATCAIAERMGDGVMLQSCADRLEDLAPNHPETRRAFARLESRCPPWQFWGGWALVAGAIAGTAARAARRRARSNGGRATVAAAFFVTLAAAPSIARADAEAPPPHGWMSKWPVDDANPETSIPTETARNADPMEFGYWLQDLALKAERASNRGDHSASAKFYVALAKAVPDRAVGLAKACDEYEKAGDREGAEASCSAALLRDGLTVHDYTHFADVMLAKPGALSDKEVAALTHVREHMSEDPASRAAADDLECKIGVRTSNVAMLRECTSSLAATAPDDARTISYEWALAVEEENFDLAAKLVDRAKAGGVKDDGLERMQSATASGAKRHRLNVILTIVGLALLLCGAALANSAFSRRRSTSLPA